MDNSILPHNRSDLSLPEQLGRVKTALVEAKDDFARLQVRDFARAVKEAAIILSYKDIAIQAAELIQDAERAIAKANPPKQGERNDKKNFVLQEDEVSEPAIIPSTLRNIRQAHLMPDGEYEKAKTEHRERGQPITRKALINRRHHVTQNTGHMEWYTPKHIIEAAREVMGGIDMDPASTYEANEKIVKATYIRTIEDDALSQNTTWMPDEPYGSYEGRIWLNPPYRQPHIRKFAERLLAEIEMGYVVQAIWLSNNATETSWGQMLLSNAVSVCFPAQRIKFLDRNFQPANTPTQGQMIVGLGPELDTGKFNSIFGELGEVL